MEVPQNSKKRPIIWSNYSSHWCTAKELKSAYYKGTVLNSYAYNCVIHKAKQGFHQWMNEWRICIMRLNKIYIYMVYVTDIYIYTLQGKYMYIPATKPER